ncbi:hypothetical protein PO124_18845 [Bacillus licheniformis]|nr:hypothetical protein [Bacillus licheniformis]
MLSSVLELYLPTLMADVVDVGIVNSDMPLFETGGWMIACSLLAIMMTVGKRFRFENSPRLWKRYQAQTVCQS